MNDFKKYLDNYSRLITNKILSLPELESKKVSKLEKAIKYVINVGGKRLRPILVLEISNILDVPLESAMRVGVALELIHCYSLVHDDLPAMDDDKTRRGFPTCHVKFDEATAILVGDALQCAAFHVLSNLKTHPDGNIRCKLINQLSKSSGLNGMVGGQMLDLMAEQKKLAIEDILILQRLKTGELFRFACVSPCILGNKSKKTFDIFEKFSVNLGVAFQIQDDLLDIEGEEKIVGKKIRKDSTQGKQTFITSLGVDQAKVKARSLIEECVELVSCFSKNTDNLVKITNLIINRSY